MTDKEPVRSAGLRPFPAKIDFVYVESAHFSARGLPPLPGADSEQVPRHPDEWNLELAYGAAGELKFLLRFSVEAVFRGGSEEAPYELALAVVAGVHVAGELPSEFVTRWLENGAQYLLAPYARAAVASLVAPTGFPVPHFPLLTVPVIQRSDLGANHEAQAPDDRSAAAPTAPGIRPNH